MIALKLLFIPLQDELIPPSIFKNLPMECSSGNSGDSDQGEHLLGSGGDRVGSSINIKSECSKIGSKIPCIDNETENLYPNQTKKEQQQRIQQQLVVSAEQNRQNE